MIILLSPAKTLDFESPLPSVQRSEPIYTKQSERLIKQLRKKSVRSLKKLMNLSEDLAQLNYDRYQSWCQPVESDIARPAIFAFKGDVYQGLQAESLNENDLEFAQRHLRILSGLHGMLRPLDVILPYRLEMGTKLKLTNKVTNLYQFWGDVLTRQLNEDMKFHGSGALVNLSSNEYFKAINKKLVEQPIITPEFRDWKNGEYKMIGFFAKKARGMMAGYAVREKITDPGELKLFHEDGYAYNEELSSGNKWVFTREQK